MKYRKKPVVIEAVQLTWENWSEICDFVGVGPEVNKPKGLETDNGSIAMTIQTLEGTMIASENDYIIKGIQGEFYPCRPDIFNETYEPVL